jgi:hypothetical protein
MAESLLVRKAGGGAKITGTEYTVTAGQTIAAGDFVAGTEGNNILLTDVFETPALSTSDRHEFIKLKDFEDLYLYNGAALRYYRINSNGITMVWNQGAVEGERRQVFLDAGHGLILNCGIGVSGSNSVIYLSYSRVVDTFTGENPTITRTPTQTEFYYGNPSNGQLGAFQFNGLGLLHLVHHEPSTNDGRTGNLRLNNFNSLTHSLISTRPNGTGFRPGFRPYSFENLVYQNSQTTSQSIKLYLPAIRCTRNFVLDIVYYTSDGGVNITNIFQENSASTIRNIGANLLWFKPFATGIRNITTFYFDDSNKTVYAKVSTMSSTTGAAVETTHSSETTIATNLVINDSSNINEGKLDIIAMRNNKYFMSYFKNDGIYVKVFSGTTALNTIDSASAAPEIKISSETNTKKISLIQLNRSAVVLSVMYDNNIVKFFYLRITGNVIKAKTNTEIIGIAKTGATTGQPITIINSKV